MIRLTKSQILLLHEQLITETGGSSGLRDEGMLDSALNDPFQTFGKEDMYPSLQQKAARLCFGCGLPQHVQMVGCKTDLSVIQRLSG